MKYLKRINFVSQFSNKMNELLCEEPRDSVGRTIYFDESNNIRKGHNFWWKS